MHKKTEAMKLALEALEAHADIGIKSDKAITAIREALAEQPAQHTWVGLTDEQQIAEALRRHGLTLVKTAKGYDVLKLGQIDAHSIKDQP